MTMPDLTEMVRVTGEKIKCLCLLEISSRHWDWRSRRRSLLETELYLIHGISIIKYLYVLIITACI